VRRHDRGYGEAAGRTSDEASLISKVDVRIAYKRRAKVKRLRTVLRFTITGMVIGLLMGWLLSLVSGNVFVVLMIGSLVTVVGIVLGIVHRNDPE
jgi:hypothetical protein